MSRELDRLTDVGRAILTEALVSNTRIIVVDAPPGAGKTHTIAGVCDVLMRHTLLDVCLAARTRAAVHELAARCKMFSDVYRFPNTLREHIGGRHAEIESRTLASLARADVRPGHGSRDKLYDILVIDEGYQETFAAGAEALKWAHQVIVIGDAGQIGPVIQSNVEMFEGTGNTPYEPLASTLKTLPGAVTLSMDASYRLGSVTADAISQLYTFPWESKRPDRTIAGCAEIESQPFTQSGLADIAEAIADTATSYIGAAFTDETGVTRALTPSDIGIGVSGNALLNAVQTVIDDRLTHYGYDVSAQDDDGNAPERILALTADRCQGLQWPVFIAVDPLAGISTSSGAHQLSTGRLCVLASRHTTHMVWMYPSTWEEQINDALSAVEGLERSISVRQSLTGMPQWYAPSLMATQPA